ncbi:zinc-binding metallopeptidase family protein [Pararhodobacter zhoushanensis]|uniref:Zinc-binding peptidase n=1 Tax=Pararhodobacter zhoushanensis TaxID=2479545 RepID=A0ABT3GTT8_9RHOB|nr:putative zinc-binding metallopeptidase [Pararhodobacter zhoushanensis]MCW1930930.1 putative zinc-binding peptidase [Pararhodobacter zhoushanensis]
MRRFRCPSCQHEVFFPNTACLYCGSVLGFAPGGGFSLIGDDNPACANRATIDCNWIAPEPGALCLSCRHTTVVPDLTVEGNVEKWARIETAKRRLIRLLYRLELPLNDAEGNPAPVFELKGDPIDTGKPRVLTGHENGTITLNIVEADDAEREAMRSAMGEPYRTLSGHVRHEVAHHYFEALTGNDPAQREALRAVFGDDRADYGEALKAHYENGPPADWAQSFISSYATAHPYEDFAETWAHVMHVLDGLETARAFSLVGADLPEDLHDLALRPMERLAESWVALSVSLNAVNQAMGHETFYPFVLSPTVIAKMEAIRALITRNWQL